MGDGFIVLYESYVCMCTHLGNNGKLNESDAVTTPFLQQTQRHIVIVTSVLALLLWQVAGMARWGVSFVLLLVVPAWWLQQYIPFSSPSRVTRWMIGATVGPALVAVLYMWAAAMHVALPVGIMMWGMWVATAGMIWRWWQQSRDVEYAAVQWWWITVVGGVVGLVCWTRLTQVEGLVFPPWVDAVHHALLIRVAYEHGQAPWDLTPYLPVTHLTFHSGYHSVMAFLMHMSGMTVTDLPSMLLYGGQILNVLAIVSVAGAAWVWWRNWPAVAVALIVAGIISIMPAFYVSWGRYTLLLGMVLLPVALVALEGLWRDGQSHHWVWYAMPLLVLSLVHMAVFVMVLAWGVVCMVIYGMPKRRVWYAVVFALVLTMPWWLFVAGQTRSGAGASAMHVIGNASQNAFSDGLFWARTNRWLIPAFVVVAAYAVYRRRVRMVAILVWVMLVAVLANPWLIRLPYISFFTNETVATALYVPLALGLAWLAGVVARWLGRWAWLLSIVLLGCAVLNVGAIQHVVRDDTILATTADREALTWIDANLPADAVIATNTAGWMWRVDRGSDGGWWALPLTGRIVTTPPVLYTYGDDAWVARVSDTTTALRTLDGSAAQVLAFVRQHPEVTHVYASERGLMKPSQLTAVESFQTVYTTGDVTIFAVVR